MFLMEEDTDSWIKGAISQLKRIAEFSGYLLEWTSQSNPYGHCTGDNEQPKHYINIKLVKKGKQLNTAEKHYIEGKGATELYQALQNFTYQRFLRK
jgi:hypothetical protein